MDINVWKGFVSQKSLIENILNLYSKMQKNSPKIFKWKFEMQQVRSVFLLGTIRIYYSY